MVTEAVAQAKLLAAHMVGEAQDANFRPALFFIDSGGHLGMAVLPSVPGNTQAAAVRFVLGAVNAQAYALASPVWVARSKVGDPLPTVPPGDLPAHLRDECVVIMACQRGGQVQWLVAQVKGEEPLLRLGDWESMDGATGRLTVEDW